MSNDLEVLYRLSPWLFVVYLFMEKLLPILVGQAQREQDMQHKERVIFLEQLVKIFDILSKELIEIRVELSKVSQTNIVLLNRILEDTKNEHPPDGY